MATRHHSPFRVQSNERACIFRSLLALEDCKLNQIPHESLGRSLPSSRFPILVGSDREGVRYPAHLRWTCTRCANSCRDVQGRRRNILLTANDTERIVIATKRRPKEFSVALRGRFPYQRRMRKQEGACVFLKGSKCSVYEVRPLICRFYPFFLHRAEHAELKIGFDPLCSGIGKGKFRGELFFHALLRLAKSELTVIH